MSMMVKPPVEVQKTQTRDTSGKFVEDKPLVQVMVNNPLTAFRLWLTKLLANEGVDVRLKIRPLTALAIAGVLALGGFSLGRITVPASSPIVRYLPQLAPPPPVATPNPWRETAFSGFLRYSATTGKYYLETANAEAITLETPANISFVAKYIGRRIFATGMLNTQTGVLVVSEATDIELLPQQVNYITSWLVATPVPLSTPEISILPSPPSTPPPEPSSIPE